MKDSNVELKHSSFRSSPRSTLSAIIVCMSIIAFLSALISYLVYKSQSSIYRTTVYIRPNTTLVLSPPGINNEINITGVSDCIEVYENVRTVSEYSLEYDSPVILSLTRNISTTSNSIIMLGQLQGIVQIVFILLDIDKCMTGRGVPVSLKNEQLDFSYFPYISTYNTILKPGVPKIYNLSGNINEYFKIRAIVHPAVLPSGKSPPSWFEQCLYSLSIIITTISYNMANVPHKLLIYPSTVDENKQFKAPIALRSLSPLHEQTVVDLAMSSVSRQLLNISQLLYLTITFGILCLIVAISYIFLCRKWRKEAANEEENYQNIIFN